MSTRDFDARTYHRVSGVHQDWADALLRRLRPTGDETVLDAGCGSGRVTAKLVERLPRGHVIAVDGAPSMVAQARDLLGDRATVIACDLVDLEVDEPVDAVFSNAVFHWIPDHDALFARLATALKPGGRLVAQCGGAGNIARFRAHADTVAGRGRYAEHFADFAGVWNYQGAPATAQRLGAAGFTDVHTWLQPWETTPDEPDAFVRTICLNPYLGCLPEELHDAFVADVLTEAGDPLVLDYVRLNIEARRP